MKRLPLPLLLIAFLCFFYPAAAQTSLADSVVYNNAIKNALAVYHQSLKEESGLYNGAQYVAYAQTIQEGIPFFETAQFNKGNVSYDDVLYEHVPLLYDIFKDILITTIPVSNYNIILVDDKVDSFTLLNHQFVRLIKDSSTRIIKTGYYDRLYQGEVGVFKKQVKTIGEDLSSGKVRNYIIDDYHYYIKKDDRYYTIRSKGDILSLFKDRKKEVQTFIRKNKLNVRKDKDNTLPKIAAYYDAISKTKA